MSSDTPGKLLPFNMPAPLAARFAQLLPALVSRGTLVIIAVHAQDCPYQTLRALECTCAMRICLVQPDRLN